MAAKSTKRRGVALAMAGRAGNAYSRVIAAGDPNGNRAARRAAKKAAKRPHQPEETT